jgi:hypothetical protein
MKIDVIDKAVNVADNAFVNIRFNIVQIICSQIKESTLSNMLDFFMDIEYIHFDYIYPDKYGHIELHFLRFENLDTELENELGRKGLV